MSGTDLVTITMECQQWSNVMSLMMEAPVPYRMSAPLISTIAQHLQANPVPSNGAGFMEESNVGH